ncbi:MAG: hypothetical protein RIR34_789 [Actinomycetota bacterium]
MPGENLTRIEAQERAALVAVDSYRVELDLSSDDPNVYWSGTEVRFTSAKPGATTFIDAITDRVTRICLNGEELDPAKLSDGVRITLPNLKAENHLIVESYAKYMNTGEGLHRFVDPADGNVYLYTQFEVPDSRRMFAVFEQPDLKATFEFVVTAPKAWKVVSNQPTPEPQNVGDGKFKWFFSPTPRISSYITALIAGPYHEVRSSLTNTAGREIPLGVFCRQSMAQYLEADYMFEKTREGFDFFEKQFGVEYPFEKYDQLYVPEFNAGAMENAGAVTFTERYIFRSQPTVALRERRVVTILHELAHMWFGDLVTMKWWNDLWLNESFADYVSHLATAEATEWKTVWATFCAQGKSWAYRQDQLPSTHPIVAPINDLLDVQINFDGITYAKGASALKQLVAFVGQENFMKGVGSYFRKHAYGNAELTDLLVELEEACGRDLKAWSEAWLETAGVNSLTPALTVDADGKILGFAISQGASVEQPTIRPHRLRVGFYNLQGNSVVRSHQVEVEVNQAVNQVPELIGLQRPDLILLNDDDLTYAKVRLDAASHKFAIEHLSKISDPLARAQVWLSVWHSGRDGVVAPTEFIDLMLNHIASEDQSMLVATLFGYLNIFGYTYSHPKNRVAVLTRIADRLWELAQQAEAGSDMQLQLVQHFSRFARTDEQVANLRGVYEGKIKLKGLDLGSDLKWELLTGLSAAGNSSEKEIAKALKADNTANGLAAAAAARAAAADADSKDLSWRTMVHSNEFSNAQTAAASLAFGRAVQPRFLETYVERYFNDAKTIWENKTFKIAEYLLERLYPANLASKELANITRKWLERNQKADRAMRRMIIENLANVERALVAQAKDLES